MTTIKTCLVRALEPHMPHVHPGDESEYTSEETREAAEAAADAVYEWLSTRLGAGQTVREVCTELESLTDEGKLTDGD